MLLLRTVTLTSELLPLRKNSQRAQPMAQTSSTKMLTYLQPKIAWQWFWNAPGCWCWYWRLSAWAWPVGFRALLMYSIVYKSRECVVEQSKATLEKAEACNVPEQAIEKKAFHEAKAALEAELEQSKAADVSRAKELEEENAQLREQLRVLEQRLAEAEARLKGDDMREVDSTHSSAVETEAGEVAKPDQDKASVPSRFELMQALKDQERRRRRRKEVRKASAGRAVWQAGCCRRRGRGRGWGRNCDPPPAPMVERFVQAALLVLTFVQLGLVAAAAVAAAVALQPPASRRWLRARLFLAWKATGKQTEESEPAPLPAPMEPQDQESVPDSGEASQEMEIVVPEGCFPGSVMSLDIGASPPTTPGSTEVQPEPTATQPVTAEPV
ncbi:unnamed protein product [Effrenium voratum]|nr:unnamed protein product [Effrenium voratum]